MGRLRAKRTEIRRGADRRLREERMTAEQTVKKLQLLEKVGRILNSTLDEREVRLRAMKAATSLMESEVGSLLLIDPATQELFFEVALGKRGEKVKEIRLKMGEGVAGWVAQKGKPVVINDVQRDQRFSGKADRTSGFVTRNMICVPVRAKDKTIGVLQAINKKKDGLFTKEDLTHFIGLSDQVAIAIENANLYKELQETFINTAEALAEAIEKRDAYTGGHARRIMDYSLVTARHLSLTHEEMDTLRLAALLHDVGKIGVEDRILKKPAKLDEEEIRQMQRHPAFGVEIVRHIPQLQGALNVIRAHHEDFDGTGYPDGLKGNKIPLMSRIIGVVDTFDAMTSDRPYRKGLGEEIALKEIRDCAGTQFDPRVVKAFITAYEAGEIEPILKTAQES